MGPTSDEFRPSSLKGSRGFSPSSANESLSLAIPRFTEKPATTRSYDAQKKEHFVIREELPSVHYRLAQALRKAKVKDSPNPDQDEQFAHEREL